MAVTQRGNLNLTYGVSVLNRQNIIKNQTEQKRKKKKKTMIENASLKNSNVSAKKRQ